MTLSPEQKGQRAERALQVIEELNVVEKAEQRVFEKWKASTSREERDGLWRALDGLDALPRELRVIRDNGVKAQHDNKENRRG